MLRFSFRNLHSCIKRYLNFTGNLRKTNLLSLQFHRFPTHPQQIPNCRRFRHDPVIQREHFEAHSKRQHEGHPNRNVASHNFVEPIFVAAEVIFASECKCNIAQLFHGFVFRVCWNLCAPPNGTSRGNVCALC